MLQVDVCPFASDALEDAMRLAQTKSLNSYTFSDCLSFLNYVWSDIYSQVCTIDAGYYSKTVRLTSKHTVLPRFVKNSVMIYAAQTPMDNNRLVYRSSGNTDFCAPLTYHISGNKLFCPDAERRTVWMEYCEQPGQIFFTHHNRDPKLYDSHAIIRNSLYHLYQLVGIKEDETEVLVNNETESSDIAACIKWVLRHRNISAQIPDEDISETILRERDDEHGTLELQYISCDYPYIFTSYKNSVTDEWCSGFYDKSLEWTCFNPFSFTGRTNNVEYIDAHWNDKTGLGVIVKDHNDMETVLLDTQLPSAANSVINVLNAYDYKASDGLVYNLTPGYWFNRFATDFNYEKVPVYDTEPEDADNGDVIELNGVLKRYNGTTQEWEDVSTVVDIGRLETRPVIKELGWTPDSKLIYPAPEVYRYLVARLAEKFASLNESNIMGVQSELVDARFAFQAFLKKDKSAWQRMRNANPPTPSDWL